jgi:hypothetical protein
MSPLAPMWLLNFWPKSQTPKPPARMTKTVTQQKQVILDNPGDGARAKRIGSEVGGHDGSGRAQQRTHYMRSAQSRWQAAPMDLALGDASLNAKPD